jgi:hypothetical protein
VCCLLVLDSVTSTPQWIRQPKPRDVVHKVCMFECECVLGSPRASQPLNIRFCLFKHFGFLTSPHAIGTRSRCHPIFSRPLRSSTSVPHRHPTGSSSSLALFTWASTMYFMTLFLPSMTASSVGYGRTTLVLASALLLLLLPLAI